MTYHIRCKKDDKVVRVIKDVKAHQFMADLSGLLLVQMENGERVFVNFAHFDFLDFSNGWAKSEADANQAKEKNGNPVITGPGGAS